jgi:hypothetical protein
MSTKRPGPHLSPSRGSPTHRATPELQLLTDHLREMAQGRDDIRTECAGVIAGSWFADTARRGEDLIAAGLLMLADMLISSDQSRATTNL